MENPGDKLLCASCGCNLFESPLSDSWLAKKMSFHQSQRPNCDAKRVEFLGCTSTERIEPKETLKMQCLSCLCHPQELWLAFRNHTAIPLRPAVAGVTVLVPATSVQLSSFWEVQACTLDGTSTFDKHQMV
jgi:hypothetical protein